MSFLITGATGFVGQRVVNAALAQGHKVAILTRSVSHAEEIFGRRAADMLILDQTAFLAGTATMDTGTYNKAIHLAWADVRNYMDDRNLTDNLDFQINYLTKLIDAGINDLTVAGTCLEYGTTEGPCLERGSGQEPLTTTYATAKRRLYDSLLATQERRPSLLLKWMRFFYVYGPGQRPTSLLSQLLKAIDNQETTFKMSMGDQTRDFINVETLAHNVIAIANQTRQTGIINVGNGVPTTVYDFVAQVLRIKRYEMHLDRGYYPYSAYEPHAFWAETSKLKAIPGIRFDPQIWLLGQEAHRPMDKRQHNVQSPQRDDRLRSVGMREQAMLTVIVPTRDRPDTLLHCLRTITSQTRENMEIIVSDNLSGPEVEAVIDGFSDSRLRYIRTQQRLGMSEHWDFALNHVKGDWVTIIGDDDGLLPGAVDKFFALSRRHPDVKAITAANCWYRWPSKQEGGKAPKLCLIGGKGYEVRDCREFLKRTLQGEVVSLPTIYTGGFVHKELIDHIRRRSANGKFFQSIIPDVYSGMAISSVTDRYIYCWEPWGIAGSSSHSNGRQHKDKTKEEMKNLAFHRENKLRFLPSLGDGCVESMQILLYESFLQSGHLRQDDMGITFADQLVLSLVHSVGRTRRRVVEYCREVADINGIEFGPIVAAASRRAAMYRVQKIARKVRRHIPGLSKLPRKVVRGRSLDDVYQAAKRVEHLLGKRCRHLV